MWARQGNTAAPLVRMRIVGYVPPALRGPDRHLQHGGFIRRHHVVGNPHLFDPEFCDDPHLHTPL